MGRRAPAASQRSPSRGRLTTTGNYALASRTTKFVLAVHLLTGVVAQAGGCSNDGPFVLRLHARSMDQCQEYIDPLESAIEWWDDQGVSAFAYEDCEIDEFETAPLVYEPQDTDPFTNDLEGASDHIPVYLVESITSDRGAEIAKANGLTLPDDAPWCQALMAITTPSPGLFAHELGHLLWLDHSALAANVMRVDQGSEDLSMVSITDHQVDTATSNFKKSQRYCKDQHR